MSSTTTPAVTRTHADGVATITVQAPAPSRRSRAEPTDALQAELGRTADHREAVEAFLAERFPTSTGR